MKLTESVLLCVATALVVQVSAAQDKKGCQDSPLISRFPGSVLTNCEDNADKSYDFRNGAATQTVEGEFHFREYRAPKDISTTQLERNYITAQTARTRAAKAVDQGGELRSSVPGCAPLNHKSQMAKNYCTAIDTELLVALPIDKDTGT